MGIIRIPDSIVLAFGGNALKGPGDSPESKTVEAQERAMFEAAKIIAEIAKQVNKILIVHGNGPQVGWMSNRVRMALKHGMHDVPLANIVASTQGAIGMGMAKQIVNADPTLIGEVAQVGTQILVNEYDIAFEKPSKPIGDFMTEEEAKLIEQECEWTVKKFNDKKREKPYRRVVPSPEPKEIVEINTIRNFFEQEIITICCGGGGIPTILKDGNYKWKNAVIDKDKAAALVAKRLEVKLLAIFTEEDGLYLPEDFRKKHNGDTSIKPIPQISAQDLKELAKELPEGNIRPKAEALADFAEERQEIGWLGPLQEGAKALAEGGTRVTPS